MAPSSRLQRKLTEIESVTILKKPFKTIYVFLQIVFAYATETITWGLTHFKTVTFAAAAIGAFYAFLVNPPQSAVEIHDIIVRQGGDAVYWILLGVLSSVGLGSGLHTFLLRLGPHIIRVTNAAVACRSTDFSANIAHYVSNTYEDDAFDCPHIRADAPPVGLFQILIKVAWPCFLWGLGTALGELPPYFVARAARSSGATLEELEEVQRLEATKPNHTEPWDQVPMQSDRVRYRSEQNSTVSGSPELDVRIVHRRPSVDSNSIVSESYLSHTRPKKHKKPQLSLMDKARIFVYDGIQLYGFWAVLVAASIPNPLFDLAGLTCGTFGIPFWTFFGATFIGKACVKVMIQALFYAVVFNPSTIDTLKSYIRQASLGMIHGLSKLQNSFVASQYKTCWAPHHGSSLLRGTEAQNAIQSGIAQQMEADPQHGVVAIPMEQLRRCEMCCEKTFNNTGADACAEGCDDLQMSGNNILSLLWQAFIICMIAWFIISFVDNIVHGKLVEEAKQEEENDESEEEEVEEEDTEEDTVEEEEEEQSDRHGSDECSIHSIMSYTSKSRTRHDSFAAEEARYLSENKSQVHTMTTVSRKSFTASTKDSSSDGFESDLSSNGESLIEQTEDLPTSESTSNQRPQRSPARRPARSASRPARQRRPRRSSEKAHIPEYSPPKTRRRTRRS